MRKVKFRKSNFSSELADDLELGAKSGWEATKRIGKNIVNFLKEEGLGILKKISKNVPTSTSPSASMNEHYSNRVNKELEKEAKKPPLTVKGIAGKVRNKVKDILNNPIENFAKTPGATELLTLTGLYKPYMAYTLAKTLTKAMPTSSPDMLDTGKPKIELVTDHKNERKDEKDFSDSLFKLYC